MPAHMAMLTPKVTLYHRDNTPYEPQKVTICGVIDEKSLLRIVNLAQMSLCYQYGYRDIHGELHPCDINSLNLSDKVSISPISMSPTMTADNDS